MPLKSMITQPISRAVHKKIMRHFVKGVFESHVLYAISAPLTGLLEASFSVDNMNFNSYRPTHW